MNTNEILKVTPIDPSKGHYFARYYESFPLNSLYRQLLAPSPIVHNERYTDVYFQTDSGNVYKIWRTADGWKLASKRGTKDYLFLQSEMTYAFLKKGERFYYGSGYSTAVIAIIAVDRNIPRVAISKAPEAQLVTYFESSLKIKGVIAKF